ncbi:pathogenesis-related protein 1-like [Nicotiana tabacum]|uniref:Pathogenesis-related protein 1-like n=2 Tax=Nicotiana TaxID=4085 RepID=A0A1S3ZGY7_TOBAC|nr:PREDICTED: pathogenesis-related protein PRB1-3-like isoform X1 [Nicotiana sylvestris]XP_009776102.1 PREDICTED: pathogenesis-related protein PRB1-3-like isoform X2 [Nicotiana sylvestris]XP_016463517.1 PREDICTED: pathogenesis-related protein PRB1-3-like [Nicotiana tabacum]
MSKAQIFLAPPIFLVFFNLLIFISSTEAASISFDWVQQEFLKAHNDLRSSVGVPPLQWDANLASFALDWATQRKQDCNYRQHSTGPYGENIFWQLYKETPPTGVVQKWFSEKKFFDEVNNVCKCQPEKQGCECGHYLNVVWKTTKKVGCSGFVYCSDQKGVYIVCSYDPIGNVKGVNPLNPSDLTTNSTNPLK